MTTLTDENGLLASANEKTCHYLRLKHDHTLLIHSQTGELFRRADGRPWRQGGYFVDRVKGTDRLELRVANGYCDHTVYAADRANAA